MISKNNNGLMFFGIVLCFCFLIACTFVNTPALLGLFGLQKANATSLVISRIFQWICLGLLWLYAARVERQDLLLWKNQHYKILKLLLHVLLLYFSVVLAVIPIKIIMMQFGLNEVSPKLSTLKSILLEHKIMLPFIAVTAGIVEEYIFRGYIQPRLEAILKNSFVSILMTSILFAAVHFGYGTLINVVGPFVIGLLFSIYYWKFRNIYTLIICHILIDLIALNAMLHRIG